MIIHKPERERLPHEGFEFFRKSKEPETIQECSDLFCWYCVHDRDMGIDYCEHRKKLKQINAEKYQSKEKIQSNTMIKNERIESMIDSIRESIDNLGQSFCNHPRELDSKPQLLDLMEICNKMYGALQGGEGAVSEYGTPGMGMSTPTQSLLKFLNSHYSDNPILFGRNGMGMSAAARLAAEILEDSRKRNLIRMFVNIPQENTPNNLLFIDEVRPIFGSKCNLIFQSHGRWRI